MVHIADAFHCSVTWRYKSTMLVVLQNAKATMSTYITTVLFKSPLHNVVDDSHE